MSDLHGRTALVTGAAGVLGMATTEALLTDGVRVVMVDLNADRLADLAGRWPGETYPLAVDISDPDAVRDAHQRASTEFGAIDILINNAGILTNDKIEATSNATWRRVLAVNLDGAFHWSQAVVPQMRARRWGRIVNTCSLAGKSGGLTAGTSYSTSKGALAALTFSVARETAADGITVNGIAPAYVRTPMVTEGLTEAERQAVIAQIPVGRFCEPEEFAHVVRFLVSPLAGFITGEIIDLNGGLHFD